MKRPQGHVIGLTGTPGTGKKTIAPALASRLKMPCVGIDDLARSNGLLTVAAGGMIVDTERLGERLSGSFKRGCVVYGHLLPEVIIRRDLGVALVLRCEPSVLKRRLVHRGYPEGKVLQNVEAELIGEVYSEARRRFGPTKVWDFDTSNTSPGEASEELAAIVEGKASRMPAIDWVPHYDAAPKLRALLAA